MWWGNKNHEKVLLLDKKKNENVNGAATSDVVNRLVRLRNRLSATNPLRLLTAFVVLWCFLWFIGFLYYVWGKNGNSTNSIVKVDGKNIYFYLYM